MYQWLFLEVFTLGKVNNREGEIKPNNKGTLMKIIKYRNYNDIDVEFLDDHHFIKEHEIYVNFKNGNIKNPYDKTMGGVGYIGVGKYMAFDNCIYEMRRKGGFNLRITSANTFSFSCGFLYYDENKRLHCRYYTSANVYDFIAE